MRPETPPITGRYIKATISEAERTKMSVTGSIPMNWPGTPGQKSIGRNAQSVVAVELYDRPEHPLGSFNIGVHRASALGNTFICVFDNYDRAVHQHPHREDKPKHNNV